MTTKSMIDPDALADLGHGQIDHDHLTELVARCLGSGEVTLDHVEVRSVPYATNTIATEALHRVWGRAHSSAGTSHDFSIFVKQLRSARIWPMIHMIPQEFQQQWASSFPWRIEVNAFSSPIRSLMPAGLRMAKLYEIVEIDHDRATIWMEDVKTDPSRSWTPSDFRRAARLLGELAGRRPATSDTCLGELESYRTPGIALRMYTAGRVSNAAIPSVLDDASWQRRGLDSDEYSDVRTRLRRAAGLLDPILDRLDELPQTYAHGDASPQNLLIPVDEPDAFVVIDWGFNSPQAVGFDLGQLLLGLVNADELRAGELPALEPQVVAAYADGLRAAGFDATDEQIREGYALSAAIRSMFTALDLDDLSAVDSSARHTENRVLMTRHLLDLCEEYQP